MQTLWVVAIGSALGVLGACGSDSETFSGGAGGTTSSSTLSGGGGSSVVGGGGSSVVGGGGSGVVGGGGSGVVGGGGSGVVGGGGAGGGDPLACVWSPDGNPCGPDAYCDAPGCAAGVCVPLGLAENDHKSPVCGCDGVTYWNVTIASVHGMAIRAVGPCAQANQVTCGGVGPVGCPEPQRQHCNFRRQDVTGCSAAGAPGRCWALPAQCPMIMFATERQCTSPGQTCMNECEAIKAEQPYYHDVTCPV